MTREQAWLVAVGAVALTAMLVAALSWRAARRAAATAARLTKRLAELESAAATPPVREPGASSYVITALDDDPSVPHTGTAPVPPRIDGRLFTDIVAREAVVAAASWTQGVRRALSPESRNRIRFQVRQQARQARRDRRAEVREALREYRARQRADEGDAA